MFDLQLQLAVEQYRQLDSDIRLVIVHPNYLDQHLLLDEILRSPSAIYVRFEGAKLRESQLHQQLEAALADQIGSTRLSEGSLLLLDECDRALTSEFDAFLPGVVNAIGKGRVIVFTRQVPICTLNNNGLRAQTRFIPGDDSLMLIDYAQRNNTQVLLEVRAFGAGRVLLNGKSVENWDGALPRSLFFYLIDQGMTTRNQIFETFWPRLSVREATNVFHVTKRKISEVLGIDLTTYWAGYYRISPDIQLYYDASIFNELNQNSMSADNAVYLIQQAISIYHSHFLTSVDMEWVKTRRQELYQTYGEALVTLAKSYEKSGEMRDALGLYLRAAQTNRQREDLAAATMRLYRDLGLHTDALNIYNQLAKELENNLGVQPAPQLQELASSIHSELQGRRAS